jgi:hypothetical protein
MLWLTERDPDSKDWQLGLSIANDCIRSVYEKLSPHRRPLEVVKLGGERSFYLFMGLALFLPQDFQTGIRSGGLHERGYSGR